MINNTIYYTDIVINYTIELIEKKHERVISNDELKEYERLIKKWWKDNKNLDIQVFPDIFYNNEVRNMYDCSNQMYTLRDEYNSQHLRDKFRSYLSVDMLTCFLECFKQMYPEVNK